MDEQLVNDITAIIPDACPRWIREQVLLQMAVDPTPYHIQARILDSAFTVGYVKVAPEPPPMALPAPPPPPPAAVPGARAAEKRKAPAQDPANLHINKKRVVPARVDYTQPQVPAGHVRDIWYTELCIKYLSAAFGTLPIHYIRRIFHQTSRLVPTYTTLRHEIATGTTRCILLKKRRFCTGPYGQECERSPLFISEKKALDAYIDSAHTNMTLLRQASPPPEATVAVAQAPVAGASAVRRPATPPKPVETAEIECGCCFTDTDIAEMLQCTEGHLFCPTCTKQNAETAVGDRNPNILCMDQSGCRAPFPDDQLKRVLAEKTLDLIDRLRQKKDLEEAKIGGLEHCPFCDFACIIVDDGRTFLCQKPTCKAVSCRKCWRRDHSGKTCEEMELEEKSQKGEHSVAEAMTKALIRDCPKCKTPFMKEAGCNKMTCPKCGTLSCYLCRQEISRLSPYTHFDQQPDAYHRAPVKGRCRLWDIDRAGRTGGSPTRTHAEDVARAEREARARLAASGSGKKR